MPANRNLAGPTARCILPAGPAGRMTLRLRCPGARDRDSEYVLLYQPRAGAEAIGTRPMNA